MTRKYSPWRRLKCKLCGSNQAENTCTRHFEEKHKEENDKVWGIFRKKDISELKNKSRYIRDHYFERID